MAELLRTRKGRTSKKKERERKSQESHSRFSKSMLTPTCRVLDVEVSISDEVTPLITHTNINHLAFFFFFCFVIQKSCAGDYAPPRWYRSWTESSGMAQCRWQNQSKAADFERTLQILRNFCHTQNGFLHSYTYEVFLCVPQNPDSDLFLHKGPIVCYTVARVIFMLT